MEYAVEMASYGVICIANFMKVGTGVQAILRFHLTYLRGCHIGITDGEDLRCTAFRWLHIA
jgi:hypothetical protein